MRSFDISTPTCPNAIVLVDDGDWEFVTRLGWWPVAHINTMYALASRPRGSGNVYLHREIIRARVTEDVDHINGNGLDNRRENLRLCTSLQNSFNTKARGGTSMFKGVFKHGDDNWSATITVNKKSHYLGRFNDEAIAALAYDEAARRLQGDFARPNFPAIRAETDLQTHIEWVLAGKRRGRRVFSVGQTWGLGGIKGATPTESSNA